MADKKGIAGKSTHEMADRRWKGMLWMGIIGIVLFGGLWYAFTHAKALGIGGTALVVIFFLIVGYRDIFEMVLGKQEKRVKRARRGARAEEKVDSLLDGLSDDFVVLNDVVSQYGNIDHIVISRYGGLFLIETKSHGGKVTVDNGTVLVNGKLPEKDFIRQTISNAYWLRNRVFELTGVKPWITPLLVFTNAFVAYSQPVKGIRVINKKYLVDIIEKGRNSSPTNAKVWEVREQIHTRLMWE